MKNQKFVPNEKLSKKAKRELDAQRRGSWNGVNPVSRIAPDRKHADNKNQCRGKHRFDD